jgi:general secretion pathway protein A
MGYVVIPQRVTSTVRRYRTPCPDSTHASSNILAVRGDCAYKGSKVKDPDERSPADDPIFVAGVDELDRRLGHEDDPLNRDAVPLRLRSTRMRAPLPQLDTSDPSAPPSPLERPPGVRIVTREVPAPDAVRPERRPSLDLFPPAASALDGLPRGNERPPGPISGTAVGPQLASRSAPRGDAPAPPAPLSSPLTYETFYGLTANPFGASADPKFLYPGAAHERAVQELAAAVADRQGVVLLIGEVGLGKTTVCRTVLSGLDRRTVASLQLEAAPSIDELLKTILVDFGVVSRDDLARTPDVSRDVLLATLRSFLESLVPLHANAVVVVDDAHMLPPDVLAQLHDVADVGRESRVLQMVLAGEPALTALLNRPELSPLAERINVRLALGPLAADEVIGYVTRRLTATGSSGRVDFSDGAFVRLYELSRGVPHVVNQLCARALSRGYQRSASLVDAALVDAAAEDLDLGARRHETRGAVPRLATALTLILLMLVGAAVAGWVFRDAVARTVAQWESVPAPPGGPVMRLPVPLAPLPPPADPPVLPDNLQSRPAV